MRRSTTRPGRRWFKRTLEAGLDFLFPPRCAGCGKLGSIWCSRCDHKVVETGICGCPNCGFPRSTNSICSACELEKLQVYSFGYYRPPLKQAILKLKYSPSRSLADQMATWLIDIYQKQEIEVDLIIPVPLAGVRRRERGYNQVELIASSLARDLDIPLRSTSLVRVQETRSQVGLDPEERFENVQNAFAADTRSVHNQRILLLDDLLTSGATLIACAYALFEAGAEKIICLTVGRTFA